MLPQGNYTDLLNLLPAQATKELLLAQLTESLAFKLLLAWEIA